MEEKKTIDMLTEKSVSILTQRFITIEGQTFTLDDHRVAYCNSEMGRTDLVNEQPENVVTAIMVIWGDMPTVTNEEVDAEEG